MSQRNMFPGSVTFHSIEQQLNRFLLRRIFCNMSAVRKRLVENEIADITLFRGIMNTAVNLLQKLNISSPNDYSLSLDTFLLLTIFFSRQILTREFSRFYNAQVSVKNLICSKTSKKKLEIKYYHRSIKKTSQFYYKKQRLRRD